MSSIKVTHQVGSGWTAVPKSVLEDARLSWKAKALWAWLVSRPDGWVVRQSHLASQSTDGVAAVRSGLDELEAFGYIQRRQVRSDDGTFLHTEYIVSDGGQPKCDFTISDKPPADNRTLVDTKSKNTDNNSIYRDAFNELWAAYPDRKPHPNPWLAGLTAYAARRKEGVSHEDMLGAVKRYAAYAQQELSDSRYVITTARFLSDQRWVDYLSRPDTGTPKVSSTGLKFL